jgi:SAM-dependent methyltransferase
VLDLGTGTGIWAIEFADQYPSASVIGTDLSPIQPTFVPSNLQFEVDDFELPWTYQKESFDFIHARALYGSVFDHRALYRQVIDHLKPGGWFEHTEVGVVPYSDDGTIQGTTLENWGELSVTAGDKFGRTLRIVDQTKELMEAAGLINVTFKPFKWPMGPWAKDHRLKDIGLYNRANWEDGMEGWLMFLFTTFHGVSTVRSTYGHWLTRDAVDI